MAKRRRTETYSPRSETAGSTPEFPPQTAESSGELQKPWLSTKQSSKFSPPTAEFSGELQKPWLSTMQSYDRLGVDPTPKLPPPATLDPQPSRSETAGWTPLLNFHCRQPGSPAKSGNLRLPSREPQALGLDLRDSRSLGVGLTPNLSEDLIVDSHGFWSSPEDSAVGDGNLEDCFMDSHGLWSSPEDSAVCGGNSRVEPALSGLGEHGYNPNDFVGLEDLGVLL